MKYSENGIFPFWLVQERNRSGVIESRDRCAKPPHGSLFTAHEFDGRLYHFGKCLRGDFGLPNYCHCRTLLHIA